MRLFISRFLHSLATRRRKPVSAPLGQAVFRRKCECSSHCRETVEFRFEEVLGTKSNTVFISRKCKPPDTEIVRRFAGYEIYVKPATQRQDPVPRQ